MTKINGIITLGLNRKYIKQFGSKIIQITIIRSIY